MPQVNNPTSVQGRGSVLGRLKALETGLAKVPAQVSATISSVYANMLSSLESMLEANYYTQAQTNAAIASPGAIAPTSVSTSGAVSGSSVTASGNVVSGGQVQSNGSAIKSLPSHGYTVTSSYVAAWINGDGTFGTSSSSVQAKTDLTAWSADDVAKFLSSITPYWGRYLWDDPSSPLKVFVTAEDVVAAGLGPDVAPTVDGDDPVNIGTDEVPVTIEPGQPWTVNYSQLVVPLLAVVKSQDARIAALEAAVAALQNPS